MLSVLACDEPAGRPSSPKFVSGFSMSKLVGVKVSSAPNLQSGGVGGERWLICLTSLCAEQSSPWMDPGKVPEVETLYPAARSHCLRVNWERGSDRVFQQSCRVPAGNEASLVSWPSAWDRDFHPWLRCFRLGTLAEGPDRLSCVSS